MVYGSGFRPVHGGVVIAVLLLVVGGCGAASLLFPPGGSFPFSLAQPGTGGGPGSGETGETGGTSGGTTSSYCEPVGTPGSSIQRQMHEALNAYRVQNGLSALLYSDSLETAADAHARDMYQRGFFSHENPDGETSLDRAVAAGFCQPRLVGENIAWGQGAVTTVPEVQAGWENSPEHNANMLESDYAFAGMGHYVSPANGHYWVQVFGTPQY